MALKWASQLTTQIWKLIYGQWLHLSKLKHTGEALDDNTKELILEAEITDEHGRSQDTPPYRYNPYFKTPLSTVLDTLIMAQKLVLPHQDCLRDDKHRQINNFLLI